MALDINGYSNAFRAFVNFAETVKTGSTIAQVGGDRQMLAMENASRGTDVTDAMIKVYAADSLTGLKTAAPLADGFVIEERKSAVKAKINVIVPGSPEQQFFKVEFGE